MTQPRFVVDASVVAKWLLPEPQQALAQRLQDLYQEEKIDLFAPSLLPQEIGNILWKRFRRGELSRIQATRCFEQLIIDCPMIVASESIDRSALELAMSYDQTMYDCCYLACALAEKCDLVTADERFYRSMNRSFPNVILLVDFEPAEFG